MWVLLTEDYGQTYITGIYDSKEQAEIELKKLEEDEYNHYYIIENVPLNPTHILTWAANTWATKKEVFVASLAAYRHKDDSGVIKVIENGLIYYNSSISAEDAKNHLEKYLANWKPRTEVV